MAPAFGICCCSTHGFCFRCRKWAGFTLGQLPQGQRTDRYANQAEHFDPQGFKHAPDLAVLSFVKNNFQPGIFLTRAQHPRAFGTQQFSVGHHALYKLSGQCLVNQGGHVNMIGLVQM